MIARVVASERPLANSVPGANRRLAGVPSQAYYHLIGYNQRHYLW